MISKGTRFRSGRHYRAVFSAFIIAPLIVAQAAYAAPPTGCDMAGVGSPYTSSFNNTYTASTSAVGTSLAASEASTAQVMETLAQRRTLATQEIQACPAGTTRIDGMCQATRKDTPASRRSTNNGKLRQTEFDDQRVGPKSRDVLDASPRNGSWAESFVDYERRTGLGSATTPAARSQTTVGFVAGEDRLFAQNGGGLLLGVAAGLSETRQTFDSSVSMQQVATNYHVDLTGAQLPFGGGPAFPTGGVYDYTLPADHNFITNQKQTLKGPSVGLTYSFFRDGFFADGVFKADIFDLTQLTNQSDTFPSTLSAAFEATALTPGGTQGGCFSGAFPHPFPYYSLSNPTTVNAPSTTLYTTALNLIYAQNFGYHFDLAKGFWLEPLVGARYTYSTYGSNAVALGLQDGQAVRVQGGARFGQTTVLPGGSVWTTAVTGLLYSDVLIRGFVVSSDTISAGYVLADQNQLRFQASLSCKVALTNGISAFAQLEGRVGNDYYGGGARIGGRYEW